MCASVSLVGTRGHTNTRRMEATVTNLERWTTDDTTLSWGGEWLRQKRWTYSGSNGLTVLADARGVSVQSRGVLNSRVLVFDLFRIMNEAALIADKFASEDPRGWRVQAGREMPEPKEGQLRTLPIGLHEEYRRGRWVPSYSYKVKGPSAPSCIQKEIEDSRAAAWRERIERERKAAAKTRKEYRAKKRREQGLRDEG